MKLICITVVLGTLLVTLTAPAQNSKPELNDQLWEAARKGDAAAVTALLDKGADVNAKFRYGTTALFKAAEKGNLDVVKVLLARGADASVKDTFYGATAMTWALSHNHFEVVRALLEKDAAGVANVLMQGARENKVGLVRIALERGGLKAETLTAAFATAQSDKNSAEIAELLQKAGAVPPIQLDAATLQLYVGNYKAEQGSDIVFSVQEGKLFGMPAGQRPFAMMTLDKTNFRPVAFDGINVTFTIEGEKVTGLTLKRGETSTVYKKVQ